MIPDLIKNPKTPKIKLSQDLKRKIQQGKLTKIKFKKDNIVKIFYRQNEERYFYSEKVLSDRLTGNFFNLYGDDLKKKRTFFKLGNL